MTPDRWRQVTALFHAALARDAATRSSLLDEACAGDPALRTEVEAMLAAHRDAGAFGEPLPFTPDPTGSEATLGPFPVERAGAAEEDLAPYRLLRRIGQGGMGVVYEAEQLQPVRRKVALKLIRAGARTEEVIARFETERQALALMNHPSIASVYEAGATRDGRPFFAMELVPGSPVTEFCDDHRMGVRGRLELFIRICEGVQHAHQKGVIHRDIKPSNVLVAIHDGQAVPKIIDFGVAKATSRDPTARVLLTEVGQLVGTPAYMSPEQADTANQDIDTRTDVYSLGVLLYELLVGVLPFESGVEGRSLDEVRRMIREEDPLPPSTRARRTATAAPAGARRTDVTGLARQLEGDLDWIILKALAKDRSRRYETASALALDVRRHLDDQPIQARPPSRTYAIGKFVRRHRTGVGAAAMVVTALLVGTLLATAGLIRARRAEREARSEAAKAVAINQFLQETLGSAHPVLGQGRDATVREALGSAVAKADKAFRDQPEVLAALLNTVGRTYLALGSYGEAQGVLRRALDIRRGPRVPARDLGESLTSLGALLFAMGDYEEAEPLFRESLAVHRRLYGDGHLSVSEALNDVAMTLQRKKRDYEAARPLLEESLAIRTRILGERHPDIAQSLNNLAQLHYRRGALDEAEALFRRAMAMNEELLGPEHTELSTNWNNLARVMRDQGRLDEAERLFRRVLDVDRRLLGEDHPYVGATLRELGDLYLGARRLREAEGAYRDALAIQTRQFPPGHWEIARTEAAIGACLAERGDSAAAEPLLRRSAAALERSLGQDHPSTREAQQRLAELGAAADPPNGAMGVRASEEP